MKAIMLSKQPNIVANVLEKEADILVCKKFPKNYVRWVYIYCTRGRDNMILRQRSIGNWAGYVMRDKCFRYKYETILSGKVVARFWCDNVEEIEFSNEIETIDHSITVGPTMIRTKTLGQFDLIQKSKLWYHDFANYCSNCKGYAIHVSKLEIFDEPKKLGECIHIRRYDKTFENRPKRCFPSKTSLNCCDNCKYNFLERKYGGGNYGCGYIMLTQAPSNYCYVEIVEEE